MEYFFSFFLNAAHPKEPIIWVQPSAGRNKQIAAFANPSRSPSPPKGESESTAGDVEGAISDTERQQKIAHLQTDSPKNPLQNT